MSIVPRVHVTFPGQVPGYDRSYLDWTDYIDVRDWLSRFDGAYIRDIGIPRGPFGMEFFGAGDRQSSLLIDGLPAQNPFTNTGLYPFVATEEVQSVAVTPQYAGFWLGGNGTLATVDITDLDRENPAPYSRIRHTEGPAEYLYTDALFSQNTSRNANLTLALTRSSWDGEFDTTMTDMWDLRGIYRWNLSSTGTLIFRARYSDHIVHLYGGVNPSPLTGAWADTTFSPIFAPTINTGIRSDVVRSNFQAEYRSHPSGDSLQLISAVVYYTSFSRWYSDRLHLTAGLPREDYVERSDIIGLSFAYQTNPAPFEFNLGGGIRYVNAYDSPNYQKFTQLQYDTRGMVSLALSNVELSAMARVERNVSGFTFGTGVAGTLRISDVLSIWSGASTSSRSPSIVEFTWSNPSDMHQKEILNETLSILEAGITLEGKFGHTRITGFYRSTRNPIRIFLYYSEPPRESRPTRIFQNGKEQRSTGGSISWQAIVPFAGLRLGLEGNATWVRQTGIPVQPVTPEWQGWTELYIRAPFFNRALYLKSGFRLRAADKQVGETFDPKLAIFTPLLPGGEYAVYEYPAYMILDFFLHAKIKTALLYMVVDNIFDDNYITSVLYPMLGQNIRFGVSWEFLD
ncbi:MAG: TonB-dependent receptor [Chlorobi bacterium]|nr:TonB-dependent receptor [Chlorobiota bacterium]